MFIQRTFHIVYLGPWTRDLNVLTFRYNNLPKYLRIARNFLCNRCVIVHCSSSGEPSGNFTGANKHCVLKIGWRGPIVVEGSMSNISGSSQNM